MRPWSSSLPQVHLPSVGLVVARHVILKATHQVLEHVDVFAAVAHDTQPLHEHGPILGGHFLPVPLASLCDEAAPALRRAISG